jgi:hypothetical protein
MEIAKLNNLKLFGSEYPKEKTGYPKEKQDIQRKNRISKGKTGYPKDKHDIQNQRR